MKYFSNDMGCVGIAIMLALLAIFPPLALVFIIVYALIADNIGIDNFIVKLQIIGIVFVAGFFIFYPVIKTSFSLWQFGITYTLQENLLWVILAIIEIIITILLAKAFLKDDATPEQREEQRKREHEAYLKRLNEEDERLKNVRLYKPNDHFNEIHVCNIGLYDKYPSRRKEWEERIFELRAKHTPMSKQTWEVYYYRIYNKPDTQHSNPKSIYPPIQENNSQNDAIPNEKEAEKNTSKTVTKVYITKSGKKYHQKNCDAIKHFSAFEINLDTAEKQGYSPCHICCKNNC